MSLVSAKGQRGLEVPPGPFSLCICSTPRIRGSGCYSPVCWEAGCSALGLEWWVLVPLKCLPSLSEERQ